MISYGTEEDMSMMMCMGNLVFVFWNLEFV